MKKTKLVALMLCAIMLISVMFTGCSSKNILKIDGENIPEGYYNYYYGYLYSYMGYYINYDDELLDEYTIAQLKQQQAIKSTAKELGLELTALENKYIIDSLNESIESMGQTNYATFLKALGMTNKQYQDISKVYALNSKIYDYYYNPETGTEIPSNQDLIDDYKATTTRATHIFFNTQEAESEDDRKAVLARAEEVYANVEAGENFYDLIREYGEDPGVEEDPETGYYFNDGTGFDPSFTSAAYALEVNEYSEIVESSLGYHIILRLPVEDEYVQSLIDAENSTVYSTYCTARLNEKLTEISDAMTVEKLPAFDSIDVASAVAAWTMQ